MIVFLVAVAGFFSPFSAFIFFPAIDDVAAALSTTVQLVNLTITLYLVVQGAVPSIFGEVSERFVRRPTYLTVLIIYIAASIGLAVQDSYGALLVLRMLQSAGSSGTIALAYGVIADIAAPHERGGYVGAAHVGFNSAPSLGPILGGVLTQKTGWKSIFWFMTGLASLVFILILFLLQETSRALVDNGRLSPIGINLALADLARRHRENGEMQMHRARLKVLSIIPSLRIIFQRGTGTVMASNAVFYMKYSCVLASLAPLLQEVHELSVLQSGLCYLSFGVSCAAASYGVGQIANYDYRATAKAHGLAVDRVKGDEILQFPIEKARLRTIWVYIFFSSSCTLGYGWSLETRAHLAAPLSMLFLIGFAVTGIFNVLNTLVVDLNPHQPATASAAVSITRCLCAAAGVSVLQLLFDAIGPGWTFTMISGLCYLTVPPLWLERRSGWERRLARAQAQSGQAEVHG